MMHEIELNGYEAKVTGAPYLMFGTRGSYGIERIHVTASQEWTGLAVTVTFCPPGKTPVRVVLGDDNCIDVPPEATANATRDLPGVVVFTGVADGVRRYSNNVLYRVEEHAGEKDAAGGITPSIVDQILAETRGDRVAAAESANAADASAQAAAASAKSAEDASNAALTAIETAETDAVQAVENAGTQASDAAVKKVADTKDTALAKITTEGTEQKNAVAAEGKKQLEEVTKKAATAEAAAKRAEDAAQSFGVGVHRYGALWDGINSACTRLYNAEGKTAAAHMGTFDAGIVNDFDNIYPWSEMRLCNWIPGTATEKAKITAFEGEPGYDASANLGAYRPEFWYSIEPQTGGGILFVVADGKLPGYHYSPPYMLTSCFVANDGSGGLQCKSGDIQCDSVSLNNYNTMNAAQGMLTEDYWADGAEKLLLTVEFAEMNSQKVTGNGFTGARYNENDVAQKTEAAANSVVVLAAAASNFVAGSQTIGLGTSLGGNQKMKHRKLIEIADYEGDATLKRLVFDGAPVDVAQGDIVYSTSAVFDGAPVGHGSGYVGANGKAISYYRGAALQTGAYMWIANILRASDETVWVAPSDATQTGAIGEDWINTGLTLPTAEGAVKHLAVSKKCPLVIQPDAVGNGATTTAPVGDYFYRPRAGAGVTALLSRGTFADGSDAGAWYGGWWSAPSIAYWNGASRSLIRNPFGGTGVATPVTPD